MFGNLQGLGIKRLTVSIAWKSILVYAFLATPFVIQLALLRNGIADSSIAFLTSMPALQRGVGPIGLSISGALFLLAAAVDRRITSNSLKSWNARVAVERSLENRQVRTLRRLSEIEVQILRGYTQAGLAVAIAGILVQTASFFCLLLILLWTIPIGLLRARGAANYFDTRLSETDSLKGTGKNPDSKKLLDWLTTKESSSILELMTLSPLVAGTLVLPVLLGPLSEPLEILFTVALTGLVTGFAIELGPRISSRAYLLKIYQQSFQ